MKKFMLLASVLVLVLLLVWQLYFYTGDLYLPHSGEISCVAKVEGDSLYLAQEDGFAVYDIKGVNLGLGKPGYYATEKAISKEEYLRWFEQIQAMGANTIRVYDLAGVDFYRAFYEYNRNNPHPLYLIHGVWVDDTLTHSVGSVWEEEFSQSFLKNCRMTVDVVHGRYKVADTTQLFPLSYRWDISQWVSGYILGGAWENDLVTYTNQCLEQSPQWNGTYFYTEYANNFEIFLASVGDAIVTYETRKYGTQRPIAFSNSATTDPFTYPAHIAQQFQKSGVLDVEHIKCTENFLSGQFASYHVYPYYPDYYRYFPEHEENTYRQYLQAINDHHTMPVVIAEFGVSSGRGMACSDTMGRNQGGISETQQGEALVSLYRDIVSTGSAGAIVFTWQDEWFKSTWNTVAGTDLLSAPYWSDYQTSGQSFGLLSFDPGEQESICYVDADCSDWSEEDVVIENNGVRLSVQYDEKFLYFLVEQEGFSLGDDVLYLPIDTTPKSGSVRAEDLNITMSDRADFIIVIDGQNHSRVLVQERYDMVDALFSDKITPYTIFSEVFPASDSPRFVPIRLLLQQYSYYQKTSVNSNPAEDTPLSFQEYDPFHPLHYRVQDTYETGNLVYGNANPNDADFHSLADFCAGDGVVEIKIPWGLLHFSDPSQMKIHDDYYACLGVESFAIRSMKIGVGGENSLIPMDTVPLKPLGNRPAYHERLKKSYDILRAAWTTQEGEELAP